MKMKASIYRHLFWSCCFALGFLPSSFGQTVELAEAYSFCYPSKLVTNTNEVELVYFASHQEFVRSIKKEYEIVPEGLVRLQNEHGNVQVLTWERDRVKIEVKITVFATTKSAADDVFNRVNLDFYNTKQEVEAHTNITPKQFWLSWGVSKEKDKYAVDYKVHMPRTCNLQLDNSHGDVLVAAIDGSAEVSLSYGDLTLDGVMKDLDLGLNYGTGVVHKSKNANVKVNYAKLQFKEAKDLQLTSSFSKIQIAQASDINCQSQKDTYLVGEVGDFKNTGRYDSIVIDYVDNFEVISQFTDVQVEKIGQSADMDLNFGEANISSVAKGFTELILIGDYVDFAVSVEPGTSYKLNASANKGDLDLPKELNILSHKGKSNNQDIEGYIGTTRNPKGSIKVQVSNGDCVIDK